MKELELFRSQKFMFYVTLFTVIALAPNTYYVFHLFSVFAPVYRELFSLFVATVISSAIMIYTVRKNKAVALNFAYFEVMVATFYYINTLGFSWSLIPALGFAIILPYSVSKSAEEIEREAATPIDKGSLNTTKEQMADLNILGATFHEQKVNERWIDINALEQWQDANPGKKPSEYKK